jgi:hypothetical protein
MKARVRADRGLGDPHVAPAISDSAGSETDKPALEATRRQEHESRDDYQ